MHGVTPITEGERFVLGVPFSRVPMKLWASRERERLSFYTIFLSRRRSILAPATMLSNFCQPRQSVSQPGKPSLLRFIWPPRRATAR